MSPRNLRGAIQPFFREVSGIVSELLWPALLYPRDGHHRLHQDNFTDPWFPAVKLWKAQHRKAAFEHYDKFLRLLVLSLLR